MKELDPSDRMTGKKGWNRDLSDQRDQFAAWCRSKFDGNDLVNLEATAEDANGRGSEIFFFTLTDGNRYVLRKKAVGHYLQHLEQDFESEYAVQRELSDKNIPTCKTYFYEEDESVLGGPFYVMEYVDGRIPPDEPSYHHSGWVTELSADEQAQLCQSSMAALARVHRLNPNDLSLGPLFKRARPGFTHNDWLIDHWRRYHHWSRGDDLFPLVTKALDWLSANKIDNEPLSISWGDARPGNTIYRGAQCAALIDFDIVHLAAPEKDLAWWLTLDYMAVRRAEDKRLPGWLSVEELITCYEEARGQAVDRHRLHYFTVYTGIAVVLFIARTNAITPDVTDELAQAIMESPVFSPLYLLQDIMDNKLW